MRARRRRSSGRWPIGRVTTVDIVLIRRSCERLDGPRKSHSKPDFARLWTGTAAMSGGGGRSKRPTLHFAPTTKHSTEGLNCSSGFSNTGREPGTRNPERGTVLMQNPVLVTGAAGFAGSHLVEQLGNSCDVVAWARSHPPAEIAHLARWTKIDLLDRDRVRQEIRSIQPSAVYHCAGASHVGASWQNTAQPLANNALATHHLLDALRRARVDARVLVAGSATVYAPSVAPLREEDLLAPNSPYAASKLAQEQLALREATESGLNVIVVRPFNHIGPRQRPDFAAPGFARQIALIERGELQPLIKVRS